MSQLAFIIAAVVASGACQRTGAPTLTLAGSTSMQPFVERWVETYGDAHRPLSIHVQGGGSTSGVQAALSGAAEIGMSSRPLTAAETARVAAVIAAYDGIAIIVHPRNRLQSLSLARLNAIYGGDARSWEGMAATTRPIVLITREEGSGTRSAFEQFVMRGRRIGASALVQDSAGAVRQMVASDPAAIGYVSLGFVDASVKVLALNGVMPSETTIQNAAYPIVRPFLFVVREPVPARARAFLDWITGPEGRQLAQRDGLSVPRM